ncbi:hypothetical protein SAMN04515674_102262 [Pseudarcicella hirudinis]|uniref:Uncharacterized protein n=1 Tax=Pseudarcicella hirudinis TaxID=1079859 RepID=A0A1I5P3R7_9BACT|nr:hypothetical protein [Pseudarcicella hirudinis]SFP28702.1 hypothetical protein SAMN04515674_102262 [Pseudarcicella hirudinis]
MKRYVLFSVVLHCGYLGFGQNLKKDGSFLSRQLHNLCYCDTTNTCKDESFKDTTLNLFTRGKFISLSSFNKLIRRDLTLITLNEEGLPSLGNYASVKYSENDSRLALSTSFFNIFKKRPSENLTRNVLTIGINASVQDNISSLFSNSRINNKTELTLKFSLINKSTRYKYLLKDCGYLAFKRQYLAMAYDTETDLRKNDTIAFKSQIRLLGEERKKIEDKINEYELLLKVKELHSLPKDSEKIRGKIDSLKIEELILVKKIIEKRLKGPDIIPDQKFMEAYEKRLYELETKDIKWDKFRISWLDLIMNFSGETYQIYDKKLPLVPKDSQIVSTPFQRFSIGISYNNFFSKPSSLFLKNGFLLKIGYKIENDNNLSQAKTKEIVTTETQRLGTLPYDTLKREIISRSNVFTKALEKNYAHVLNVQATRYFNESKKNALSIYYESRFQFNNLSFDGFYKIEGKPVMNFGLGYFFAIQKKEDLSSLINLELYLKFNDILNSQLDKINRNFYQRNEIGLKIGLPFNSLFINQQ